MSLSKLSILDHLREVLAELSSSQNKNTDFINDLCESELATLIHQFYQNVDGLDTDSTSSEKRKRGQQICGEIKKFRSDNKEYGHLSSLELLPNEIYEKIILYTDTAGKKSLSVASKWLYNKTTLLASIFQEWTTFTNLSILPKFVLKSDKLLNVKGVAESIGDIKRISNLGNRFAHRISSLTLKDYNEYENYLHHHASLIDHFACMKPAEFPHLTSLELDCCELDFASLMSLAPQLERLALRCIENLEFNLPWMDEDDECFSKIKSLSIELCQIDLGKILTNCYKTLKHLKWEPHNKEIGTVDNLKQELSSLNYLHLKIQPKIDSSENAVKNLLSKSSRSLKTLKLFSGPEVNNETNYSILLDQPMLIHTLELMPGPNINKIDTFLNKCPLTQRLTIHDYKEEVNGLYLKDLTELRFNNCNSKCMTSFLHQASRSSKLKTLSIDKVVNDTPYQVFWQSINIMDELRDREYPRIPFLDTVRISYDTDVESYDLQEFDIARNMFPAESEVSRGIKDRSKVWFEEIRCTEFRRVYNIQESRPLTTQKDSIKAIR